MNFSASYIRLTLITAAAVLLQAFAFPLAYGMESAPDSSKFGHRTGIDTRGAWLIPTNDFFRGENYLGHRLNSASSIHLKYAFTFPSWSREGLLHPTAYQGIGVACNTFFDHEEIGTPVALYVFQGARIADIGPKLTLDYEWNFGISYGWHPYDGPFGSSGTSDSADRLNDKNTVVGSKFNAYINAGLMLTWRVTPSLSLNGGIDLTHFSNGNTKYPNAGVNCLGARLGAVYGFGNAGRNGMNSSLLKASTRHKERFIDRLSVDAVIYGSVRVKGMIYNGQAEIAKGKFGILGVNINPLYKVSRCFQAGISADIQYDESANVFDHVADERRDNGSIQFYRPALREQIAAGLSLRAELTMPIFSVAIGFGHNVIYKGQDMTGFYQLAALKAHFTKHLFLHIGYKLRKFHDPNNLMLGLGWKFGARTNTFFSKKGVVQ